MLLKYLLSISLLISLNYASTQCSPYYNPKNFYYAPEYLQELLLNANMKQQEFNIQKNELYKFTDIDIANEINDNFGGFWTDWIGDAYEMKLVPEQTLFRYKNHYFFMEVIISGVIGDDIISKGTNIKYHFYSYDKEVQKYIKCKKENK